MRRGLRTRWGALVRSVTVLVAAAVIEEGGRFLLTKRLEGAHLAGQWEFPGGKVEPDEDPRDAVVRECLEECEIEIEVGEILEVVFHRFEHKSVLLLFYRCTRIAGEVAHLGVADHAWVRAEELADYDLPPADAPVIARLLA